METVRMNCPILFYEKNKNKSAHNAVSNNSKMSAKKIVLRNYAFPEQWNYLFQPFQLFFTLNEVNSTSGNSCK